MNRAEMIVSRKPRANPMRRWLANRNLLSQVVAVARGHYEVWLEVPPAMPRNQAYEVLQRAYRETM